MGEHATARKERGLIGHPGGKFQMADCNESDGGLNFVCNEGNGGLNSWKGQIKIQGQVLRQRKKSYKYGHYLLAVCPRHSHTTRRRGVLCTLLKT